MLPFLLLALPFAFRSESPISLRKGYCFNSTTVLPLPTLIIPNKKKKKKKKRGRKNSEALINQTK
jgi:hypothetical protein